MATPQTTYFGDLNVTGNTTMSGNLTVLGSFSYFTSNLGAGVDGQSTIGPVGQIYVGEANTTILNVTAISNGIGIGTSANSGTALNVSGNLVASNAIQTPVVRVTTANATGANTTAIFTPTGFLGINTTAPSGTRLYVPGFVNAASNTLTTNVSVAALNVTTLNTISLVTRSNLAIGTTPASGGATLQVVGNAFGSNALQTTSVFAATVNVTTANTTSIPGPVGVAGVALSHANLSVTGNVVVSNAFTTPAITASGSGTVSRILNVTSVVVGSNVGIGTTPVPGGTALHVIGNLAVSNTISAPSIFTNDWNISGFANTLTVTAAQSLLVAGATGANVSVTGNVFVSNSIQVANGLAGTMNTTTMNTVSITGPIISVNGTGPFLYFPWASSFDPISPQNFTTTSITGSPQFTPNSDPTGSHSSLGLNDGSSFLLYEFLNNKFIDLYNGGITYMTWVKMNQSWTTDSAQGILTFNSRSSSIDWSIRLYRSGTSFVARASKGSGTVSVSTGGFTNGTWRHVAMSLNAGNNTLRLYVDGALVDSGTLSSTNIPPLTNTVVNQWFGVGVYNNLTTPITDANFAGTGLFPELSASQIASIYAARANDTLSDVLVYGNALVSNTLVTGGLDPARLNVAARSNITSLTVTSNVGIRTAPVAGGPGLAVQGNIFASNSLTTGNVIVTRANGTTLNTSSIFGPTGNVGVNTTTSSGTTLFVQGNIYATNTLAVDDVSAPLTNVSVANATSIVNRGMGIGTASIDSYQYFRGATQLVGDAPTSNTAIYFPNTDGAVVNFGSSSPAKVNYATTNTFIEAWIYLPVGSTGGHILTYSNSTTVGSTLEMKVGTNLYLEFQVEAAGKKITDQNQLSTGVWNHVAFAISLSAATIACWKNGTQDSVTNTRGLSSPVYIASDSFVLGDTLIPSNSFNGYIRDVRVVSGGVVPLTGSFTPAQAPFTVSTPSYVSGGSTVFVLGILTDPTLIVQRNAFISNSLTTTNVLVTTANVTTAGIDFVPGPVGINTTAAVGGPTLIVSGNIQASNALVASRVNVVTANVTSGITLSNPLLIQNLGGTGNTLETRGNAYVSNEVETTNLTALTSLNTTTLNVLSISGRTGINTTLASGTALFVNGNVYASNGFVTTNAFVTSFNVSRTTNTNTVELATATVRPAPDLTRYLRGSATIASSGPSYSDSTLTLSGGVSSNPPAAVFGAAHPLNFDANTSNTMIEAFIYHTDTGGQSYKTIFTIGDPLRSISTTSQPLLFTVSSTYSLICYLRTDTGSTLSSTGSLSSGVWYHVAAFIDVVNSTVSLAINGTLGGTVSITGGLISNGPLNFSAAIGASQNSGNKYGFPGYISDLRVVRGGEVPSVSFTAPTAPGVFSSSAPSYFTGGTTIFTLSDYMSARLGATLTVGGNVLASNAITTTNINSISSANVTALGNVTTVSGLTAAVIRGQYANVALSVGANVVVSNALTVSNIFGTRINATTLNTSSIFGNVGINTTGSSGTALYVQGNLYMSNVTTNVPNVYATTSVNVSGRANTTSIFGQTGFVGVNTTAPSGTALYVQGNLYMSNVTTNVPNVYATTSVNVSGRANTTSIFSPTGFVGVNTTAPSGTTLYVLGNLYASNALTGPNINVVTANATTTNVSEIFGPSGSVGINTTVASGTALYVLGNIRASNALTAPTINVVTANVTTTNVSAIYGPSEFVGINTTVASGTDLYVFGNLYTSNALTAPNINVVTANATTTNVSAIFGPSGSVGINTTAASGTDLYVRGNLFASNALVTPNINVVTTNAATAVIGSGNVGVGTTGAVWSTLYVSGNAFVSNSFTAPGVGVTSGNASTVIVGSGNVGIGTVGPIGSSLYVQGNLVASNALTAPNLNVVTANVTTTNVSAISGVVGINTTGASGTTLYVLGNIRASNALTAPDLNVVRANASTTNVSAIFGPSGFVGINTTGVSGTTLYVAGNLFASNALTAPDLNVVRANASTTNVSAIFGPSGSVGINTTAASGTDLYVRGNLLASNALTAPNLSVVTANTTTMNVSAIYGSSGFVGLNTTAASGTTLYTSGNIRSTNTIVSTNIISQNLNSSVINTSFVSSRTVSIILYPEYSFPAYTTVYPPTFYSNVVNFQGGFASSGPYLDFGSQTFNLATLGFSVRMKILFNGIGTYFWQRIIDFNSGINGIQDMFLTFPDITNTLRFQYKEFGYENVTDSATPLTNGVLYDIAVVYDPTYGSTGSTSIYINGVLDTFNSSMFFKGTDKTYSRTFVGQSSYPSDSSLAANIYYLEVFNRALTPQEITQPTISALSNFLKIDGNVYVSNSVSTIGVSGQTMNATSTLNASSLATQVVIAGSLTWSNTNIFIANSITTTNIFTTNVNAAFYSGSSGFLGINTSVPSATLHVQGNLASSNALLTVPDVSALGNIYYVEDLTARRPHLRPSQSNAAEIQAWIAGVCNAASQPDQGWWVTSPTPTFANISTGGSRNNSDSGSVLLPDGTIMFVPFDDDFISIFNPFTNEYSQITPIGFPTSSFKFSGVVLTPSGNIVMAPRDYSNIGIYNPISKVFSNAGPIGGSTGKFRGAVLAPNGNVVCIPYSATNVGMFNPDTSVFSNVAPGVGTSTAKYTGGVLLPTGNIVFVPIDSANIGMFDPTTFAFTNIGPIAGTGKSLFSGGVLTASGNIVFVPRDSANIGVFNPSTNQYTNVGPIDSSTSKYFSGGLLPNGNVIFAPQNSSNIGMYDPTNLTASGYSNCVNIGGVGSGHILGATLIPDGRVVFAPYDSDNVVVLSTFTPVPVEFCLSPYFNKF